MNRGAVWGKWDLHIHTPASYEWQGKRFREAADEAARDALCKQVIDGVNASGCVAVAVMDYWTFDGVFALRDYLARHGGHDCRATIFPGIELRMVAPGDYRLNVHVVLNPQLSDDKLTAFKTQLKLSLTGKPLTNGYLVEWAREHLSEGRLGDLGTSKAAIAKDESAALLAACKTAEVTPESVAEALKVVGEKDAILFVPFDTSDGVHKIKFRQHYSYPRELLAMEAIFEVSNLATRDAFVGVKTSDNARFFDEFQDAIKHPKLAVRGSDAHSTSAYGQFPGGKATWIKAKPSFAGLLQACREPANRSFVGDLPQKADFVGKHPHLFIKQIRIRKRPGAPEPGEWFAGTSLALNADLVALIGRKGSGKSALADVIGLLGDTPNERYFSFLSDQRFRLPKDNKAGSFEAQLEWEQDTKGLVWRGLSAPRSGAAVQRVKYLPQRYFEELCNDHVKGDDSLLQDELRAVIFSHIPQDQRDGAASLAELTTLRTEVIEQDAAALQAQLKTVNARVVQLSAQLDPDACKKLRESVRLAVLQLRALREKKPKPVAAPQTGDAETTRIGDAIGDLNKQIAALEAQQVAAQSEAEQLRGRIRSIDEVSQRLTSLEKSVNEVKPELEKRLSGLGLAWANVVQFSLNRTQLVEHRESATATLESKLTNLASSNPSSFPTRIAGLRQLVVELQSKLDGPMRAYQESLETSKKWEEEWQAAVGAAESDDTFRGRWTRLRTVPALRAELANLRTRRKELARDILFTLHKKADVLRELFAPVQELVDEEPHISQALGVQFSVRFSFDAFVSRLFDYIKQNAGSFVGLEESKALAGKLLASHDLTQPSGLDSFLDSVEEALSFDVRSGAKRPVAPGSILRSDRTLTQLYDFLFGLDYVDLSYGLMLGSVELERLSPGQRGALLLIFYLLVDRDRIPIVLDQPEENLDNETVYQLLVGVIARAKQHRQVIMVTHNANLAVACDAEQVVVCSMARDGSNRITYKSGSIEEVDLNRDVVDILEGTKPAFENRRRKYS